MASLDCPFMFAVIVNCRYPKDGWELYLGYVMENAISARAGANLLQDLKAVDQQSSN